MTSTVPGPPVVNGLVMVRRFGPSDPRFDVTALPVVLRRGFGDAALADVCEFECVHDRRVISPVVFVERGIVRCRPMVSAATAATGETRHGDWGAVERYSLVSGDPDAVTRSRWRTEQERDACALELVAGWTEAYRDA